VGGGVDERGGGYKKRAIRYGKYITGT